MSVIGKKNFETVVCCKLCNIFTEVSKYMFTNTLKLYCNIMNRLFGGINRDHPIQNIVILNVLSLTLANGLACLSGIMWRIPAAPSVNFKSAIKHQKLKAPYCAAIFRHCFLG